MQLVIDEIEVDFDGIELIPEENAVLLYRDKEFDYAPRITVSDNMLSDYGRELLCN